MKSVHVTVLSRRGLDSLPGGARDRIAARARITGHACHRAPDPAVARELLAGCHVLAATNACLPVLDAAALDAAPLLGELVLYATGTDHVDTELLASRGVRLSTLPDYATVAVAEHAIAMVMCLATRAHLAHDRSRGQAASGVSLRGVELAGRTLGVVGTGRIGGRVARLGQGLGMRVVGCDPRPGARPTVPMVGLDTLLAISDVIAVCASRRYGQPPLIGPPEVALVRPDAFLVNVSRAALVDTAAVCHALRARRLRGYAVDDTVLDPVADADLLDEGRVLQTGHSAWWRDEVLERGAALWSEAIMEAVDRAALPPTGDGHQRLAVTA